MESKEGKIPQQDKVKHEYIMWLDDQWAKLKT